MRDYHEKEHPCESPETLCTLEINPQTHRLVIQRTSDTRVTITVQQVKDRADGLINEWIIDEPICFPYGKRIIH